MWKEVYGESITYLKELILSEERNWKKLFIENNATNKFRNMNNKKVVRLTESQLHIIIAESVEKILMEMDGEGYRRGIEQHPNLMNKVRPETYNKHARMASDKYLVGRSRAADAKAFDSDRKKYVDPLAIAAAQGFTKDGRRNIGDDEELSVVPGFEPSTRMPTYHSRYSKQEAPHLKNNVDYDADNDTYENYNNFGRQNVSYSDSEYLKNDGVRALNKRLRDVTKDNIKFGRQNYRRPEGL